MAGYWPRSFFACLWTETNGQYPAILTEHTWLITHTYFNLVFYILRSLLILQLIHSLLSDDYSQRNR